MLVKRTGPQMTSFSEWEYSHFHESDSKALYSQIFASPEFFGGFTKTVCGFTTINHIPLAINFGSQTVLGNLLREFITASPVFELDN